MFITRTNRLFPRLILKEKNNIYLSINTRFTYYTEKEKTHKIILKPEHINKEKTIIFLNFFIKYLGKIDSNCIKDQFETVKNDNNELISKKIFLSSNLFLGNNSINLIPMTQIWTLLLSFKKEDSPILEFIIRNFLSFEKEIFYIVKNNFYDTLDDKSKIKTLLEFTDKMSFFYKEDSFLWGHLIQKKIKNGVGVGGVNV